MGDARKLGEWLSARYADPANDQRHMDTNTVLGGYRAVLLQRLASIADEPQDGPGRLTSRCDLE
jgi:hypothetical protein